MSLSADEMCRIAAEFTEEHGDQALDCARRAVYALEAEGAHDRALFWFTLCVFIDDIAARRVDPDMALTLH